MSDLCWNRGWCELVCSHMSVEVVDCGRVTDHDVVSRRDPVVLDVSMLVTVFNAVGVAEAMRQVNSKVASVKLGVGDCV